MKTTGLYPKSFTARDRFLAPFVNQTADRPAWVADLGYWYEVHARDRTLPERWRGDDGLLRLHEELGVIPYYQHYAGVFTTCWDGASHEVQEQGGIRRDRWRTPRGELTARWEYLPAAASWAHVEYPVKTARDLTVLQDISRQARHEPEDAAYPKMAEHLGERGLPLTAVPRSPLPALLADWCGVMQTAFLMADEPAAVTDTLGEIDRSNDAAFAIAARSPAPLFHFCDNLDSRNAGSFFAEHMAEYYQRRLAELHATGKFAVVHLDGAVRGLLPGLAACGFDGIEAITPAPVGDVAIEELRALAGNHRTILWGGLPGAMFCAPWTAADIRAQTRRWLDALGDGGRLIVGSADQVPPDGDIQLCRVVADTIAEWAAG